MTEAAELTALLKDYGPWGLLSLSLLANRMLLGWWRDCMTARIEERGTLATTIERQAASNVAAAATLDDVREGQVEIARLVTQALKAGEGSDELTKEILRDIKNRLDHRGGGHA